MFLHRISLALLAAFLAATPSRALWSDVAPTDTLWRLASEAPMFLVRTGDARLDDAIEQGFSTNWPAGSWSWIPDSGIAKIVEDSTATIFRLVETRNPFRRTRERDCQKLTGLDRTICLDEQAGGKFRLEIGGKKLGRRSGTMLLEAPSQARRMLLGDAYLVDLPGDFAKVLQSVRDSAFPKEGPFLGTRAWAREMLVHEARSRVGKDTLWVLSEQVGSVPAQRLGAILGAPVQTAPAADFESMLGTGRAGTYLEAGLLPTATRQLRIRDLATGELLLLDDWPTAPGRKDTLLKVSDFERLAHRAKGEEFRPFLMGAVGPEISFAGLMGLVYTAGYEFARGWWGLAGWANWSGRPLPIADFDRDHVLVGVRWTPMLAWESPGLGSARGLGTRISLGARYWQPYGESDSTGVEEWLDEVNPHISLDVDLLGDFWYVGASPEIWFGTNTVRKRERVFRNGGSVLETSSSKYHDGGWSFRAGIQYGFQGWRPGVSWKPAKGQASVVRTPPARRR